MIAWVDIETTGLDVSIDQILEIAVVITDDDLNVVSQRGGVVSVSERTIKALATPEVQAMHTSNGLISSCDLYGVPLSELATDLAEFIRARCDVPPVMGGSTIDFDRKFLECYAPELHRVFHYRSINVSSVRELARRWCPHLTESEPPPRRLHRAMPDLHDTIELAHYYKKNIFNPTEAPQ